MGTVSGPRATFQHLGACVQTMDVAEQGRSNQWGEKAHPEAFMSKVRLLPIMVFLAFGVGCELFGVADTPEITKEAEDLAKDGDLPAAHSKYLEIQQANPASVHAAMGLAYSHVLRGEYPKADMLLANVDTDQVEPELAKKLRLRRALVALKEGDVDQVIALGEASGTAIGKLLAAEGRLADGSPNEAIPLFEDAEKSGGAVGDTAKQYLDFMRADDPLLRALAEASALWAIGEAVPACESAQQVMANLDEDVPNRNEMGLLWAGRAATVGDIESAVELLDSVSTPPEGQAWRVQATRALIHFRKNESADGVALFVQLASGGAPADGLADAIATAAAISGDANIAKEITAGLESSATARSLLEVGDRETAIELAPSGPLKKFLKDGE
jgi:hypothetical protein